jgi:stage II sporulation protein M
MTKFVEVFKAVKGYFGFVALLFVVSSIMGYSLSEHFKEVLMGQLEGLQDIRDFVDKQSFPTLFLFGAIFLNNTVKSIAIMYLGFALGVIPLFFIIMNGLIIGFLLQLVAASGQDPLTLLLVGILPHGILELPAILIASAIGLKMGSLTWRFFLGLIWNDEKVTAKQEISFYMKRMGSVIGIITIVLLVAALIETFITGRIATLFLA